jgi:hypothetical protein
VTRIPLHSEYLPLVESGRKRSTIRAGQRQIPPGKAEIVAGGCAVPVQVTQTVQKPFKALDHADAIADGFDSLESLRGALHGFYPGLSADDIVSVIYFERTGH